MKKNEKAKGKKDSLTINWIDDSYAVSGVKNYSDSCCFFNLYVKSKIGSIAIYGCKVVSGEKGDFIGFPSRSYEVDGKTSYRDISSIIFEKGMQEKIIQAVSDML